MKTRFILLVALLITSIAFAQQPIDTVVIKVGDGSKVIFAIKDKKDLETMKKYNFQKLMDDMIYKLQVRDSSRLNKLSSEFLKSDSTQETLADKEESVSEPHGKLVRIGRHERKFYRTRNSFNVDVGTNNYLSDGKFTNQNNSLYDIRPWGSWYIALNSTYRTRMANKFYLEWGGGFSWYNFKFENTSVALGKDNTGVLISTDPRNFNFSKSKLTAAYVNISAVPVLDFGGNHRKAAFFDGHRSSGFRIGLGPYVGYLIDSYSKQVYTANNDKKKEVHHDNYYLNNLRYGLRLQLGFKNTDFFFNYDLNQLFVENKGPKLNAFSFGVTF